VARRGAGGRGHFGRADLTEPELRQEILKLRRRVEKLAAMIRGAHALLHTSGFRLSGAPLPADQPRCESCAPWIGRASGSPLRAVLRFMIPLRPEITEMSS
jgi:hypothetical protein